MPPTPVTQPRRATNAFKEDAFRTKAKSTQVTPTKAVELNTATKAKLDVGESLGVYDTNNIRDKVLKWQQLADDSNSEAELKNKIEKPRNESSKIAAKRKSSELAVEQVLPKARPQAGTTSKEPESSLQSKPVQKNLTADLWKASAPKKRIISDEHWTKEPKLSPNAARKEETKLDKLDTQEPVVPGNKPKTGPAKPNAWVRKKSNSRFTARKSAAIDLGILNAPKNKGSRGSSDQVELSDDEFPESPLKSTKIKDDSIRIKPTPLKGSCGFKVSPNASLMSPLADVPQPRPPKADRAPRKTQEAAHVKRKSLRRSEIDGYQSMPALVKPMADFSEAEPMEDPMSESTIPPQTYGNSIEAWLTDTPDPFVDDETPLLFSGSNRDKIDGYGQGRRRSSKRSDVRHDERYHHEPELGLNYHNSSDVTGRVSTSTDITTPLAGTLKRTGAKRTPHSPTGRSRRSPTHHRFDDDVSAESLSADDSTREFSKIKVSHPPNTFDKFDKRAFPTTGNRLSTIVSVETFRTTGTFTGMPQISEDHQKSQCDEDASSRPGVKRKLTSHADLISVLSLPQADSKSIRSARSIRTARNCLAHATVDDLMKELAMDEAKYLRELQTLVDGVIPVLLSCVLSKTESSVAAGLFGGRNDKSPTSVIVNMGIALERLKSNHKRIPTSSSNALLLWAQSAYRVYEDYIQAWKMGFQDVVVNLVPAEDTDKKGNPNTKGDTLPQNDNGDIVNGDGERVDVAFLLKRPLVRIKRLARTIKGICQLSPSGRATELSSKYQHLVVQAQTRQNEERARMEDESAASIDATRARQPQTLAPMLDVRIDPTRCVRARDYFDLQLQHSSGQRVDCHVELLLRDAADRTTVGDVLICEVDDTSRWLLFPPVSLKQISARSGDAEGQIVVMIRGYTDDGQEWREVLVLRSSDEKTGPEWIQMFGLMPIPPEIPSSMKFMDKANGGLILAMEDGSQIPYASEMDIPIGEPSEVGSRRSPRSPKRHAESLLSSPTGNFDDQGPFTPRSSRDWASRDYTEHYIRSLQEQSDCGQLSAQYPGLTRPGLQHRTSSVPSKDLPAIPKARDGNFSVPRKPVSKEDSPRSPAKLQKAPPVHSPSPASKTQTPSPLRDSSTPHFTPASPGSSRRRRSSSPLKHEYAPSSASSRSSRSSPLNDGASVTSDSSADDVVPSVPLFQSLRRYGKSKTASMPVTLSPSESASQAPYRTVPQQAGVGPKTVASIFSWSNNGLWERLHPDECSIIVTPGLIEAFEMTAAHSATYASPKPPDEAPDPRPQGIRPLVGLELTPLVPLRRGTAIDISIRSPTTGDSQLKAGNNIMFRSPNPQECELLYNLINHARINNPTYIALQNARGPHGTAGNWAAYMDHRAALRTRSVSGSGQASSWWRRGSSKRSSYRAGSTRQPRTLSISGETDSSVASLTSAFSALRRFSSSGGRMFNVAKSSITSRAPGGGLTRSSTTFSSSGATDAELGDASAAYTPPLDPAGGTPLGLSNQKIRIYEREAAGKWRDMGAARLTIMHPARGGGGGAAALSPARQMQQERRVVVIGKTQGERLLDVTLGETSFERVARTGIALSVVERLVGPNGELGVVGKTGGVWGGRVRVYMIQMKSEAEAAYTFSLVGRLRY